MKEKVVIKEKRKDKNRNWLIREFDTKKMLSKNSGITLVALVCTIVILLILAGITITMLFGENGIIKKAQDAGDATKNGQADEIEGLDSLEEQMIDAMYGGSKIEDWEYTLNEENGEVILNKYIGDSENINIKGSYTIGDKTYKTVLGGSNAVSGEKGPFYTAKIGRDSIKKVRIKGNVTVENNNAAHMFSDCTSLEEVDIKGLDTNNVTVMACMFKNCSSLKNLDISYLNGDNVEYTVEMFSGCRKLEFLKLPDFSSGNLKNIMKMFSACSKLKEIDVSKINTSNLNSNSNNLENMFYACTSLEKLDLSNWNMSNIKAIINTFTGCINIKEIDLSGSELSNLSNISRSFSSTRELTTIYVKTENDKTKLTNLAGSGGLNLDKCNIIVKGEN